MNFSEGRTKVVEWLRAQLIGPASEMETLRGISPLERYPTGVLYPVVRGEDGIDPASLSEDEDDEYAAFEDKGETSDGAEAATKRRRYTPPSSVGFSFFARGDEIRF